MFDSCLWCRRPEHEHTQEELRTCWEILRMDIDFDQRPDTDDIPPQEM